MPVHGAPLPVGNEHPGKAGLQALAGGLAVQALAAQHGFIGASPADAVAAAAADAATAHAAAADTAASAEGNGSPVRRRRVPR